MHWATPLGRRLALKTETRLLRAEPASDEGFASLAVPVTRASTIVFPSSDAFERRYEHFYDFLRPSASYRATAEADLLDGMQRRQECVSFPELGNDCCRDRQPVIAVGRRIDCSHKCGAAIVSRCSPETEVSHQRSAVIETRLYSMRIEGVEARVDTQLIRKIVDHSRRWLLVVPQEPPCLSHRAELNGEAQLVLRSPAEFAFQSICRVQSKVTDQTILVRRYAQQYRRFL